MSGPWPICPRCGAPHDAFGSCGACFLEDLAAALGASHGGAVADALDPLLAEAERRVGIPPEMVERAGPSFDPRSEFVLSVRMVEPLIPLLFFPDAAAGFLGELLDAVLARDLVFAELWVRFCPGFSDEEAFENLLPELPFGDHWQRLILEELAARGRWRDDGGR